MSLSSLIPIGTAAVGVLASRAMAGLADGFAFQSILNDGPDASTTKAALTSAPLPPTNLLEAVPEFADRLRARLQHSGVDLSHEFTLREDGHGGIQVDGDHPDRSLIEEILHQEGELAAQFRQLAAAASEQRDRFSVGSQSTFGEFRLDLRADDATIRFG